MDYRSHTSGGAAMRMLGWKRSMSVCLAIAIAQVAPQGLDNAAASPADSVFAGTCEGSVVPFGIILPPGGFEAGCSRVYVLKYGTGSGDRGRYGLLDLPPCPAGP